MCKKTLIRNGEQIMNEITCRGCGRYESECTCNVPTIDKDTEIEKLRARIAELEALIPTPKEAFALICWTHKCSNCPLRDKRGVSLKRGAYIAGVAKLQKIIYERG